jgi:hypothetical protein
MTNFNFDDIDSLQLKSLKNALEEEIRQRGYQDDKHFYLSLIKYGDIVVLPSLFEDFVDKKELQVRMIFCDILIHSKSECDNLEVGLEREIHRELLVCKDLSKCIFPPMSNLIVKYHNDFERSNGICYKDCKSHIKARTSIYLYSENLNNIDYDSPNVSYYNISPFIPSFVCISSPILTT